MTHLQNHNSSGFSLIEVLLALMVVGIVLVPLFGMQSSAYQRVSRTARRVSNFFFMRNYLLDSRAATLQQEQETASKVEKIPGTNVSVLYDFKPAENPAFKNIKYIMQEQVVAQWQEGRLPRRQTLVNFVYRPAKKEAAAQKEQPVQAKKPAGGA